jgi:DNA-binding IclR family transcriptional regulator
MKKPLKEVPRSNRLVLRSAIKTASTQKAPMRRKRRNEFSSIAAVDRAAQLLLAFAKSNNDIALVDLSKLSDVPKPTAFRILSTLVHNGLVIHNAATETYNLGFFVLRLADIALAGFPIRDVARPVMRRIRDVVNESVVLSVRLGDTRHNIDSIESSHAIGQNQKIGVPIPLYAGAASRVMLAAMKNVEAYWERTELIPLSNRTIIDTGRLSREILKVKDSGYATSFDEFPEEGHSIAVDISDDTGDIAAALHISIAHTRYTKDLEQQCIQELLKGARQIREDLKARAEGS